ncbi:MAG: hypothetical protein ACLQIB_51565 [Isosphaeraceae bacterium]
MWLLSRIGLAESLFVLVTLAVGCCLGRRGLRWVAAIGPLLVLSVLLSPPDLFSMLIVAVFLILAFALGIYWAPHLIAF